MQDIPQLIRSAIPKGRMRQVAAATGVSYDWLTRFCRCEETHTNPTWNQLRKLADYLGL